jgi:hypothetical protein
MSLTLGLRERLLFLFGLEAEDGRVVMGATGLLGLTPSCSRFATFAEARGADKLTDTAWQRPQSRSAQATDNHSQKYPG